MQTESVIDKISEHTLPPLQTYEVRTDRGQFYGIGEWYNEHNIPSEAVTTTALAEPILNIQTPHAFDEFKRIRSISRRYFKAAGLEDPEAKMHPYCHFHESRMKELLARTPLCYVLNSTVLPRSNTPIPKPITLPILFNLGMKLSMGYTFLNGEIWITTPRIISRLKYIGPLNFDPDHAYQMDLFNNDHDKIPYPVLPVRKAHFHLSTDTVYKGLTNLFHEFRAI